MTICHLQGMFVLFCSACVAIVNIMPHSAQTTFLSHVSCGCWPSGKCLLTANSANQTRVELQIALLCKALLHTSALQTHVRHQHGEITLLELWMGVGPKVRPTLANDCLKSMCDHHLSIHHKSTIYLANIRWQPTQRNSKKNKSFWT